MIEYFGIFAIGIIVGILGTLMIFIELRKRENYDNIDDEDFDEEEFENLDSIFIDEDLNIPEEEKEIKLPEDKNGIETE